MTTATLEAPAPASFEDLKKSADAAYEGIVVHFADHKKFPDGWQDVLVAAGRTRQDYADDVNRLEKRREARAILKQAEKLTDEVAALDTRYAHVAAERDKAEAEQERKHQAALERIREPAEKLQAEADSKRHQARSLRERSESILRSLVSKEAADAAKARIEALESERAAILNSRSSDGARGIVPSDMVRTREDTRLGQISAEVDRLSNLWRTA
ncbi:MAG: hypothetical protein IT428_32490 [Planctomycetaceae bacterium]|nr:hypothetical protein [Planctomycetaceae bacterium]